VRMY